MESEKKIYKNAQPRTEAVGKTSENRRKLIQGALIGAPVLLALKSTPVLACNCKLPSGFSTSGNLSRNGGATCTDPAKGPTWWPYNIDAKNKFSRTNILKSTVFKTIFGGTDGRSFLTILNSGVNFSSLVVAAYLDVKASHFVFGVTDLNIKQMWIGTFKPPGSTNFWSAAESENYLRYTMGLPLISINP